MSARAIRITARIAFAVCGIVSLVTSAPYAMLRGAELPVESEWIYFVVALALVGSFSLLVAVLPRSWLAKMCRKDRDDLSLLATPLKWLVGFAVVFYFAAAGAYLAPRTWELNPQLMLILCPMYFLKMTIDPSPVEIFGLLAPMNAGVYGSVGLALGYVWLAVHGRR